jgi:hypothetical protein
MAGTYSFSDTLCTINGPGLAGVNLSQQGEAEEGISWRFLNPKNIMTGGAAGDVMHSLAASNRGEFIIRLLKTSPLNAVLGQAYFQQSAATPLWGINVITVTNTTLQDSISGVQCAFRKFTDLAYRVEGGMNAWEFDVGILTPTLGGGTLSNIAGILAGI